MTSVRECCEQYFVLIFFSNLDFTDHFHMLRTGSRVTSYLTLFTFLLVLAVIGRALRWRSSVFLTSKEAMAQWTVERCKFQKKIAMSAGARFCVCMAIIAARILFAATLIETNFLKWNFQISNSNHRKKFWNEVNVSVNWFLTGSNFVAMYIQHRAWTSPPDLFSRLTEVDGLLCWLGWMGSIRYWVRRIKWHTTLLFYRPVSKLN